MRISDWSSDVCSSDLVVAIAQDRVARHDHPVGPTAGKAFAGADVGDGPFDAHPRRIVDGLRRGFDVADFPISIIRKPDVEQKGSLVVRFARRSLGHPSAAVALYDQATLALRRDGQSHHHDTSLSLPRSQSRLRHQLTQPHVIVAYPDSAPSTNDVTPNA